MKCPIDNNDLQMTERQGIEIDYCPKCRGVWLDRGELDKIIESSNEDFSSRQPQAPSQPNYQPPQYGGYYGKHGRRKSILGELFDF